MTSIQLTGQASITRGILGSMAAVIAAIGFLTLLGWVLDIPVLTSWHLDRHRMAPSTAILSILLSIVLVLRLSLSSSSIIYVLTNLLTWLGALVALFLCPLRVNSHYLLIEHLGLAITGLFDNAPVGYISIYTAICFLLAFTSLLILNTQKDEVSWHKLIVGGLLCSIWLHKCFLSGYSWHYSNCRT